MLSKESEQTIVQIFTTTAQFERSVDITRQVLAEVKAFEPETAFQRIDKEHKGYLTPEDLLDFLQTNSYENEEVRGVTLEECKLCVSQYDDDRDGTLSYQEFLYLVLPARDAKMRRRILSRPSYVLETGVKLPFDVEYALVTIMNKEIQLQNNLENLRRDLINYGTDIHEAFKAVKCFDNNLVSIDAGTIRAFLERNREPRPIPSDNLAAIVRRYDRDGDSRINYKEFERAMTPSERLVVRPPEHLEEVVHQPILPYKSSPGWNESTKVNSVNKRHSLKASQNKPQRNSSALRQRTSSLRD